MVVLDTCCIIELCKPKPSLTQECLEAIDKNAAVLSICFAEISCKIKTGKLILDISAEKLFESYNEIESIQIIDIGCKEWFDSINLNWKRKDPVDRLLVSYANRYDDYIVTTDKEIEKYYNKVMW